MTIGNRVYLEKPAVKQEWIEAFSLIPTANIADVMAKTQALHPRIKLMSQPSKPIVAGSALTVKTRAGDNLFIYMALMLAEAGDVLIIDAAMDNSRALMGEIMLNAALYKQLGAVIIDGAIRDHVVTSHMELPIYATGITPLGPYRDGPGEINTPVACGGVVVNPGDLIVADEDGVVVVPLECADKVLEDAKALSLIDQTQALATKHNPLVIDWMTKVLATKETEIIDAMYYPEVKQG